MPTVVPSTVAEAEKAMTVLATSLPDRTVDPASTRRTLTDIHRSLMRATPSATAPPLRLLGLAAEALTSLPAALVDRAPPRPRTVFRLLKAGQPEAAWEVLSENAIGVIDTRFTAATATGAARSMSRLPLLTRVEAPAVFAELPGFRDPRFAAPDECYDIGDTIRLRHGVEEIYLDSTHLRVGGWAALDLLTTAPDETVSMIASGRDGDVVVAGRRRRRPDLVGAHGRALTQRAWAGWSASLDLTSGQLRDDSWSLSLQLDHAGVVRRCPLGGHLGKLAKAATAAQVRSGGRQVGLATDGKRLRLALSAAASDTVGG